jgi:hypothetical protein
MKASAGNRIPWRVVLPVLVGGVAAITSGFASFRMKPPPPIIRVWHG